MRPACFVSKRIFQISPPSQTKSQLVMVFVHFVQAVFYVVLFPLRVGAILFDGEVVVAHLVKNYIFKTTVSEKIHSAGRL